MSVRTILRLGDEQLHGRCEPVMQNDVPLLQQEVKDLHETMQAFQRGYGWGRAISAPQIGCKRRIVAMHVDRPFTFYNPVLDQLDQELVTYWEDCMSFPDLMVRVQMPKSCRMTWRDEQWQEQQAILTGDYAALLQHEVDHLDGVLATMRAVDDHALALRDTHPPKDLAWNGEFHIT